MSTVMYCYWIEKGKEFEVAEKVRNFLEENWFIFQAKPDKMSEVMELIYDNEDRFTARMQLFPVSNDHYLARFLIDTYIIENNYKQLELEPCYYDNRSDMPEEWEPNKIYAEIIDGLISKQKYYIIPLVDPAYINLFYFRQAKNSKVLEKSD